MINGVPAFILEEEIANNYNPDDEEVIEYAEFLGMDIEQDQEFFYIAREGLKAPLPSPWKPIQDAEGELYFYNFENGEVVQEHPCDEYYKDLYQEEKAKKEQKLHEQMILEEQERLAEEEEQIIQEMRPAYEPQIVQMQSPQAVDYQNNINQDVAQFTENYNQIAEDQIVLDEESDIPDINEYEDERINQLNKIMDELKDKQNLELSKVLSNENMDRMRKNTKKELSVKLRQEKRKLQNEQDAELKEWRKNLSVEDYQPDLEEDHQDLMQKIEAEHEAKKETIEEKYQEQIKEEQLKAEKEADNIIDMAQGKAMDSKTLEDLEVTEKEKQQIHDRLAEDFKKKLEQEDIRQKSQNSKGPSETEKIKIQCERKEKTRLKEIELEHLKEFRTLEKESTKQFKDQKDEISKKFRQDKETYRKDYSNKTNELNKETQKKIDEYKITINQKLDFECSEEERKLSNKLQSKRKAHNTDHKTKDALKEVTKLVLDLENEKIRARRESKNVTLEVEKLEAQLKNVRERKGKWNEDGDIRDLEEELDVKQRRLVRVREMIQQKKEKMREMTQRKTMKRAKKVVDGIGEAIDRVDTGNKSVLVKPPAQTSFYSKSRIEETKIPISHQIEEIFDFTTKERSKIIKEKEKAQLEYRLISGLRNNLHKENASLKQNLSATMNITRKGLLEIYSNLGDQSDALEAERKELNDKIEKCSKKEKILQKICNKKDIMKESTSSKLSTNISKEISSDYEFYMRTYFYKPERDKYEESFYMNQTSEFHPIPNQKTMYTSYSYKPTYTNLNRLITKVFPQGTLKNNFFTSIANPKFSSSKSHSRPPHPARPSRVRGNFDWAEGRSGGQEEILCREGDFLGGLGERYGQMFVKKGSLSFY
ncbi:unnamed protein product [Moneuplotes crassus]|uniref:WW domain-containing protein n=1 Tax=Euplotes crassus TaxID=5936 RepID=A0AAD2D3J5_EUPCR|nr:unnamed protein product [Moneuplotes crassus]